MTYTTHVQPQRRQYSTNAAAAAVVVAATVEEVDSVDSEEVDDYEPIKEGTRPIPTNTYSQLHLYPFNVQPNRIQYRTTPAEVAAAIEKENSEDSEKSNKDNKPIEEKPKQSLSILYATKYAKKTLSSVRRTNHHSDEKENDGGNTNSDTECSSETCESKTNFQLDAVVNSTSKRKGKSNEALQRKNKALKNSYWIKNEKKRRSNKYYKMALLDLNDSDISSIPTGEDHQVR